jgi:hypothetical protein
MTQAALFGFWESQRHNIYRWRLAKNCDTTSFGKKGRNGNLATYNMIQVLKFVPINCFAVQRAAFFPKGHLYHISGFSARKGIRVGSEEIRGKAFSAVSKDYLDHLLLLGGWAEIICCRIRRMPLRAGGEDEWTTGWRDLFAAKITSPFTVRLTLVFLCYGDGDGLG